LARAHLSISNAFIRLHSVDRVYRRNVASTLLDGGDSRLPRQRNFERVFFLLSLALFFFYSGSLLALNAQIYYSEPPALLTAFAKTLLCAGLCFLPPLLVHLHLEYAQTRGMLPGGSLKRTLLVAAYAPALYSYCGHIRLSSVRQDSIFWFQGTRWTRLRRLAGTGDGY